MIDANTFCGTLEANPDGAEEAFAQCFDQPGKLTAGEGVAFTSDAVPDELGAPGLIVRLEFGEAAFVIAIPATLPLPAWYSAPDESQSARLQTLAMEWSFTLAPEGFEATEFKTVAVENVADAIGASDEAEIVPLGYTDAESGFDGTLYWVGPLVTAEVDAAAADDVEDVPPAETPSAAAEPPAETGDDASARREHDRRRRIRRVQRVPVQVVVELAAKKVELDSVLALTPGSLVTFTKSCDEPADLFVNNYRYCRGEAVKIGENFGLKVTEVGVVEERERRVF